jgi:hypothetical protein
MAGLDSLMVLFSLARSRGGLTQQLECIRQPLLNMQQFTLGTDPDLPAAERWRMLARDDVDCGPWTRASPFSIYPGLPVTAPELCLGDTSIRRGREP